MCEKLKGIKAILKTVVKEVFIFIVYLVIVFILKDYPKCIRFSTIAYLILIAIRILYILKRGPRKKNKSKLWIIIVIPLSALLLVIAILWLYPDDTEIKNTDILNFSGDFLAFAGAFSLGFFIYQREQNQLVEEKQNKIKLLLADIEAADQKLMLLSRYVDKIQEEKKEPDTGKASFFVINYNRAWRDLFLAYDSIVSQDADLKKWLEDYYGLLEDVNTCLYSGDILRAHYFYDSYSENENYSTAKYNNLEAELCLSEACSEYSFLSNISWKDDKKTIQVIQDIRKNYFSVIENFAFNEVIRSPEHTVKANPVNRKITDYMINHSRELRELINTPDKKRILMEAIFQCALKFKQRGRIELVWGEYILIDTVGRINM